MSQPNISEANRRFDFSQVYNNAFDTERARNTLILVALGTGIFFILQVVVVGVSLFTNTPLDPFLTVFGLGSPLITFAVYLMLRWGYLETTTALVVIITFLAGVGSIPVLPSGNYLPLTLPILFAGIIFRPLGVLLIGVIAGITTAYFVLVLGYLPFNESPQTFLFTTNSMYFVLTIVMMLFYNGIMRLTRSLSQQINQAGRGLSLSHLGSLEEDEEKLIGRALTLARQDLGFAYAQAFIINSDGKTARRVSSLLGMEQVRSADVVDLAGSTAIAEAIRTRSPFVVTQQSGEIRRRYLLPSARSSLIVPLLYEGQVYGALDVQQERTNRFNDGQVETMNALANQVSGVLTLARKYRDAQSAIKDQEELILRQRQRLHELERTQSSAMYQAWQTFLREEGVDMLGYDFDLSQGLRLSEDFSPELKAALEQGEMVIERIQDRQLVSIPIRLNEQSVGAMSFTLPPEQILNPRQIDLMQSVGQRLSLALENRRLFEQSRTQAQREAKANEVASLLLSSTDIETVLKLAASQFNEALGAIQTRIHLQAPQGSTPASIMGDLS